LTAVNASLNDKLSVTCFCSTRYLDEIVELKTNNSGYCKKSQDEKLLEKVWLVNNDGICNPFIYFEHQKGTCKPRHSQYSSDTANRTKLSQSRQHQIEGRWQTSIANHWQSDRLI